jgi:hypothetical protein
MPLLSKAPFVGFSKCDRGGDPDFLRSLVTPAHFMRLSLKKAAYAVASSAAYGKSGSPHRFRPRYATANLGHPSYSFGLCYDTDSLERFRACLGAVAYILLHAPRGGDTRLIYFSLAPDGKIGEFATSPDRDYQ